MLRGVDADGRQAGKGNRAGIRRRREETARSGAPRGKEGRILPPAPLGSAHLSLRDDRGAATSGMCYGASASRVRSYDSGPGSSGYG